MTRQQPYGSWSTPITSELVVRAAATLSGVALDGDTIWWSELRPEEGGRTVLVRRPLDASARAEDVLPAPWNARTRVHEYGGGAWWVRDGVVWFAHWDDQRLYRLEPGDATPRAVTPEPETKGGDRFADGVAQPDGSVVCVRERHPATGGEAVNEVVKIPPIAQSTLLVTGPDFVSNPRPSDDGVRLAWLQWNHPNMPWDGTELVVDGIVIAGSVGESIFQPAWGPDGFLYFVSDRTGWWNLYRWSADLGVETVVELEGEIGVPQWVFGQSRYAFLDGGRIALAYQRDGFDHLAVTSDEGGLYDLDVPDTAITSVVATGDTIVYVGASATADQAVVAVEIDGTSVRRRSLLRPPRNLGLEPGWISVPEAIDFPTTGGERAHALVYPPANPEHDARPDERPPLLVIIHGGPTSAARPMLQASIQYWTSRGFTVADVNYRGSTGYGRAYRDALKGQWGIVDVDDCVACATWLSDQGRADANRLFIRGGSAGGYTTLAVLAFRDTFSGGASHYGVADLEALAVETHKFESRYLDGLIGPYPGRRDLYVARSPIHHVDGIDCPLIVFQGLEDEVVPPNQAEMIVAAVRAKGVPVAYVPFEGEQHGFRRAENIRRSLDGELSFYAQVFGFELPAEEAIEAVPVENLA